MKRLVPVLLLLLVACDSKKPEVSQPPPAPTGPSEFVQRVNDRTISMLDWKKAGPGDRSYFIKIYTKLHLGRANARKERDMKEFLEYTRKSMEDSTKAQGWSEGTAARYLAGIKLFATCKAGARVMGWPFPKRKF